MDILIQIFSRLVSVSLSVSVLVLAVILLRYILTRAPKWTRVLLWAVVGLRLLLPFQLAVPVSRYKTEYVLPVIYNANYSSFRLNTGVHAVDAASNIAMKMTSVPEITEKVTDYSGGYTAVCIWLGGMAVMLCYFIVSALVLKRKTAVSVRTEKNVAVCDNIKTPFIFGVFRPVIYLPSSLTEDKYGFILKHEKAHIRRRDHLIKPAAFLLLTVYWFLPPLWPAFILLCRDIELACDEKAVASESAEYKKEYSSILLECTARSAAVAVCPLAFGGGAVKRRIKNIVKYKKPLAAALVFAIVLTVALAAAFLLKPSVRPERVNAGYTDYYIFHPFDCLYDDMLSTGKVNAYPEDSNVFITGKDGIIYIKYGSAGEPEYYGTLEEIDGSALWDREDVQKLLPNYIKREGLMKTLAVSPSEYAQTLFFVTGKGTVISAMFNNKQELLSLMITSAGILTTGKNDYFRSYASSDGMDSAKLTLDTATGLGTFTPALYSDYLAFGFYSETEDRITLATLDKGQYRYVFGKEEGSLKYLASASRPGPGAAPKDKTVLEFVSEGKNAVTDPSEVAKTVEKALGEYTLWDDGKGTGLAFLSAGREEDSEGLDLYGYLMTLSFEKGSDHYTVTDETVQPAVMSFIKKDGRLETEIIRYDISALKSKKDFFDGLSDYHRQCLRQSCCAAAYAEMDKDGKNLPIVPVGMSSVMTLEQAGATKAVVKRITEQLPEEIGFYLNVGYRRGENGMLYETYIDRDDNTVCFIRYDGKIKEPVDSRSYTFTGGREKTSMHRAF